MLQFQIEPKNGWVLTGARVEKSFLESLDTAVSLVYGDCNLSTRLYRVYKLSLLEAFSTRAKKGSVGVGKPLKMSIQIEQKKSS